ncbi:YcxB family protein [Streptomyces sp. NPDC015661]|uniref:YcxB family protein n=1 Tax=Streptomyces sp. NPDC015661 TaxID=3364961 RepID=UPI0036F6C3A0
MAARDAAVAFVYTPTEADYRSAVRRFSFGTLSGLAGLLVPVAVGVALASFYAWRRGFTPAAATVVGVCVLVATGVIIWRSLARVASEQYSGTADYGTCTTVVDGDGMTTTGGGLDSRIDWQAFPRYIETDELFVFMPRRLRVYFVLPKRGAADPADVDRVRAALVAANLHRLRGMPGMTARR